MVCRDDYKISVNETTHSGFLLVQMVVYLALTALIVLYTMQWAVSALIYYHRITTTNTTAAAIACATDVWIRDMRRSIGPLHHDHTTWLWNMGDTYVAWYVKNHALIRAEGSYAQGRWHERTQSLMAETIASLTMLQEAEITWMTVEADKHSSTDIPYTCTRMVHIPWLKSNE